MLISLQMFFATRAVLKIGEYIGYSPAIRSRDAFRPIARERKYLMGYKYVYMCDFLLDLIF